MALSPLVQEARQQSLGDLPRRTARRTPDKLAVVDGDVRLTFAELDAVVDRTAAALQHAGIAAGDRLALLCHNSWQFIVLNFACARAGIVLVPINFMLGADEVAFILDHSGAGAFVVEDALLPVAQQALAASKGTATKLAVVRLAGGEAPEGWGDVQPGLNALSKVGDVAAMMALVTDDMLSTLAVRGTPEECAAEVGRRFGDLAGRVCCYFPGYDPPLESIAALRSALASV